MASLLEAVSPPSFPPSPQIELIILLLFSHLQQSASCQREGWTQKGPCSAAVVAIYQPKEVKKEEEEEERRRRRKRSDGSVVKEGRSKEGMRFDKSFTEKNM